MWRERKTLRCFNREIGPKHSSNNSHGARRDMAEKTTRDRTGIELILRKHEPKLKEELRRRLRQRMASEKPKAKILPFKKPGKFKSPF
jgi:hypothetical protein